VRKSEPKELSTSISSVLQQLGLGSRFRQYEVLDKWASIVGDHIAHVTTPQRMDNGKLLVHVTRSTWRNELVFLKKEIISKINKAMNQEIVKDIIFR
jgi:predicted nucleic acid-binding Zn ribbon protein